MSPPPPPAALFWSCFVLPQRKLGSIDFSQETIISNFKEIEKNGDTKKWRHRFSLSSLPAVEGHCWKGIVLGLLKKEVLRSLSLREVLT